jgi:hypothetical protein
MILEEGYDFMTIPADLEWGLTDETVMLKGDGPAPVEEYVEMAQSFITEVLERASINLKYFCELQGEDVMPAAVLRALAGRDSDE